ncbi:MAG TPA: hypothetical protein VME41_17830 [Stellaceae bacterium]|nr:hypothetical protein [Stellaceae bacterium]
MAMYQSSGGAWTDSAATTVGPMTEGAAGIAVIVLTILGLSAISPAVLTSVATIIVGAALLVEAANTGLEYSKVNRRMAETGAAQTAELGADVTVELAAGFTGIVLGVLALLAAGSIMHLLPAALIVFGGAMLIAGLSATSVGGMTQSVAGGQVVVMEADLAPARGLQILVGVAAIVLGILAFVVPAGGTLLMVGLLVVGGGLLATSANFTQSFIRMLSQ